MRYEIAAVELHEQCGVVIDNELVNVTCRCCEQDVVSRCSKSTTHRTQHLRSALRRGLIMLRETVARDTASLESRDSVSPGRIDARFTKHRRGMEREEGAVVGPPLCVVTCSDRRESRLQGAGGIWMGLAVTTVELQVEIFTTTRK